MQTQTTEMLRGTSYEIICAADRMVPSILYLLLELHPAMMIPNTSNDIIASKKNKPELMEEPDHSGVSGRTAKPVKTAAKIIMGASLNNALSAFRGTISTF